MPLNLQKLSRNIGLAWLVGLLLLLPLAQSAATWHLLFMHSQQTAPTETGGAAESLGKKGTDHALHEGRCDLCLTAAAVAGGALPVLAAALPAAVRQDAAPLASGVTHVVTASLSPYQSRAPPFRSS